jgi:hypothetical protein
LLAGCLRVPWVGSGIWHIPTLLLWLGLVPGVIHIARACRIPGSRRPGAWLTPIPRCCTSLRGCIASLLAFATATEEEKRSDSDDCCKHQTRNDNNQWIPKETTCGNNDNCENVSHIDHPSGL